MKQYDAVIVGAGVAGACTARECARYALDVLVLEAGLDVAEGATRANSGIVHAGYDPKPGSLKAKYNVAGSKMYPQWAAELGFPYKNNQSLVLAFTEEEMESVQALHDRGVENGVEQLRVIDSAELQRLEPNVSKEALGALLVPTGGIADPYQVAWRSAENAAQNGVAFRFGCKVLDVAPAEGGYQLTVQTEQGAEQILARTVVNAAGVHADELNNMVSERKLSITPRRGDYCLLDNTEGHLFQRTMFQAPTKNGKGVLVSPTVHGNLLVGPNAVAQQDKDVTATTRDGLDGIVSAAKRTFPELSMRQLITNFAGIRATGNTGDFVIGQPDDAPGFFNIACFESPGLTSAPAVAADIASQIAELLDAPANPDFDPVFVLPKTFHAMDESERAAAIDADPRHGRVLCRCREVSEADVVSVVHTNIPVLCLDAIKWRTEAMMGRCHGGFCMPEITKAITRELGVRPEDLPKRFAGTQILTGSPEEYVETVKAETDEREADWAATAQAHRQAPVDFDVAVIGGGAAGISAAAAAAREGAHVALIDREPLQGGILKQCIHNGFGLHRFGKELTGPEYATAELAKLEGLDVTVIPQATVTEVAAASDAEQAKAGMQHVNVSFVSPQVATTLRVHSAVMATGSRERGAGALNTAGTRPAGVFSAGSAQNYMNLQGCLPGKEVVILGSGDIGLIMARRLTFAGAKVVGVFEINPTPSGLRRNIVQCLDDFGIPLYTSQTVTEIHGDGRIEAVTVSRVDERYQAIPGTERRIACDTLLLSVGLIPENQLAEETGVILDRMTGGAVVDSNYETNVPGVFACGNALHIHDLVDFVSDEGDKAGLCAARHALGVEFSHEEERVPVQPAEGVRYVIPQYAYAGGKPVTLRFRTSGSFEKARLVAQALDADGNVLAEKKQRVMIAVPAEMQSIEVDGDFFKGAACVKVRVQA
ncbi:MAG: FAD-dependent oxidoreductase [Coriobacteriia bacterium]|nr:FAD-dependent oxidoreductase [Coriobacteriia bacterium]